MAAAVTKATAAAAVKALLKWRESNSETQKANLLDSEELLYLVVSLKKIPPKGRVNAYKVPLPHPLHSPHSTEFCLIFDDRPKSTTLTKAHIQAKIKAHNLPIVKILKYSKLKSDYKAFEAKRKLLNSFDMFVADKRIVPLLPRLLGKEFFKKKRIPVPVDLRKKNWKEQIDRVCGSALLFLSTGTCCVVRVARTSMSEEEIVENVVTGIEGVVEVVPGGWGGLRSLHLKLLESIALPVYQTVPELAVKEGLESNEVVEKSGKDSEVVGGSELKKAKRKKEKVVEESSGKATEDGQDAGGELRKSKRIKEKDVGESKVEKLAKSEIAEKPTRKVVNPPKVGEVKGEEGEKQVKKSVKAKDDVALNVEKQLKKSVKAKDDVVVNVEKQVKKSVKAKNDVVVNVEKPLKSGKVKDDAADVVKHKTEVLSAKDKKKDVKKKKGEELPSKGGEAVGKKVKGEEGEKQVKKSVKAKDDVALNVEKQVKKSVKAKDDVVVNVEKPLKSGKVKDAAAGVVKHKTEVLSVKDKKKDVKKKKGEELPSKGGEAVGKKEKRKSEPVQLKSEDANLKKAKRSKKGVV